MKTIFKGNKFSIVWEIFHNTTRLPFDFTGMNIEVSLTSNSYSSVLSNFNVKENVISTEIEANSLPSGVYDILCRFSTLNEEAYCFYKNAFHISNNPCFCDKSEKIEISTYATYVTPDALLTQFNSIYLTYLGNPKNTRNNIPEGMRRKGLIITYTNESNETITERATSAAQKDNDHWGLDTNWSRIDELSLSGDLSVSANGTWIINGEDTQIKAVGPKGDTGITPWLKTIDNRLYYSYDGKNWEACSEEIAAFFRFKSTREESNGATIGNIQISRDNKNWQDLSPEFVNHLRISAYVSTKGELPTNKPVGTMYGVGPTYKEEDTARANPIYRIYVYDGTTWVDNGSFTSIAAGIVQETGEGENVVMSQKAVTKHINDSREKLSVKHSSILDKSLFTLQGYINTNGYGITKDDVTISTDFFEVSPNDVLNFSLNEYNITFYLYDVNREFVQRIGWFEKKESITIPENVYYIKMSLRKVSGENLTPTTMTYLIVKILNKQRISVELNNERWTTSSEKADSMYDNKPYGKFQNGTIQDGVLLTSVKYRVASNDIIYYNRDITVDIKSGFKFCIHTFVDGAFAEDLLWQTGSYKIKKGTYFKCMIARVTENKEEVADIVEFLDAISINSLVDDVNRVKEAQGSDNSGIITIEANFTKGYYDRTSGSLVEKTSTDSISSIAYTPIKGNSLYKINNVQGYRVSVYFYNEINSYIGYSSYFTFEHAFITPADATSIRVSIRKDEIDIDNMPVISINPLDTVKIKDATSIGIYVKYSDGSLATTGTHWKYEKINIKGCKDLVVYIGQLYDDIAAPIAFYDSEDNYLQGSSKQGNSGTNLVYYADVPANAEYAICCGVKSVVIKTSDLAFAIDSMFGNNGTDAKNITFISNPFAHKPLYHHLNQEVVANIPAQSLHDIAYAKALGFDVIEANVHKCSDGVYVTKHGSGGKLGTGLLFKDGSGVSAETLFSDISSVSLRENVTYDTPIEQYRGHIPTLDEFCSECKRLGLRIFLQVPDAEVLDIAHKYFADEDIIVYAASSRGEFRGWMSNFYSVTEDTTIESILSTCDNYGAPFIYGGFWSSVMSDAKIQQITTALHEKGYLAAAAYQDSEGVEKLSKLGVDAFASLSDVNIFEYGNKDNIFSVDKLGEAVGGVIIENGIATMPINSALKHIDNTFLTHEGKVLISILFSGVLSMKIGRFTYELTGDAMSWRTMAAPISNTNNVVTFTSMVEGTSIKGVKLLSSVVL